MTRLLLVGLLACAGPALALDLPVPVGVETTRQTEPADSVRLPEAPWSADRVPETAEGRITRWAYRATGGTRTTLQLLTPLENALVEAGYETVFTCADRACGGFDFRFQLDLIGEPDMHVDLGDYRYLLARREGAEPHTVSVVTSRSAEAGFIHVTEVGEAEPAEPEPVQTVVAAAPRVGGALIDRLVAEGHAVLENLDFETGAAELGPGPFPGLEALGAWLVATPGARVLLVGHTDAVGSLEANTALSLRRARAVADKLVNGYGAAPAQVEAEGAGFLAPRASNLSETGRAENRRVEVVLLSVEIE